MISAPGVIKGSAGAPLHKTAPRRFDATHQHVHSSAAERSREWLL